MAYYGILEARYWTGPTGRAIRQDGGRDAQLLGVYLLSNEHMNMLGLYEIHLRHIREELGLSPTIATNCFSVLRHHAFACYDFGTGYVWVKEMAAFRLGVRHGEPLAPKDKRSIGARNLYEKLLPNPWLAAFFDRYAELLRLKKKRVGPPETTPPDVGASSSLSRPLNGTTKGQGRGSEGGKKGARSQYQDQDQSTDTGTEKSSAADAARFAGAVEAAARPAPLQLVQERLVQERPLVPDYAADNVGVITKLAHEFVELLGPNNPDLTESIKQRCASLHIAYDAGVVGKAIDSARFQRERARRHA